MFRSSMFYRRWWYVKKRNIKKIHFMLRLALAAILIRLVFYVTFQLFS